MATKYTIEKIKKTDTYILMEGELPYENKQGVNLYGTHSFVMHHLRSKDKLVSTDLKVGEQNVELKAKARRIGHTEQYICMLGEFPLFASKKLIVGSKTKVKQHAKAHVNLIFVVSFKEPISLSPELYHHNAKHDLIFITAGPENSSYLKRVTPEPCMRYVEVPKGKYESTDWTPFTDAELIREFGTADRLTAIAICRERITEEGLSDSTLALASVASNLLDKSLTLLFKFTKVQTIRKITIPRPSDSRPSVFISSLSVGVPLKREALKTALSGCQLRLSDGSVYHLYASTEIDDCLPCENI